jgi:type II secretory pathway component PulF
MRLPAIGPALQVISLSRLAWSLGLALDSGADARQSLRLALQSTSNEYYRRHLDAVDRRLLAGDELHTALRQTGAFPVDFLDALEVGEQSGRVSEILLKLADDYRQRAQTTMTAVTVLATSAVWCLVAGLLIFLIFRIAGFYFGMLDEVMKGF